jgi:hypothetical protein
MFSSVHVAIAHNEPYKGIVIANRECANNAGYYKNQEGIQQWSARLVHRCRHLFFPERNKTVLILAFIPVDLQVNFAGQGVQVLCGTTGGVLRTGKRKIICYLDEQFSQLIRPRTLLVFYNFFKFFPARLISLYKCRFFHIQQHMPLGPKDSCGVQAIFLQVINSPPRPLLLYSKRGIRCPNRSFQ